MSQKNKTLSDLYRSFNIALIGFAYALLIIIMIPIEPEPLFKAVLLLMPTIWALCYFVIRTSDREKNIEPV